MKHRELGLIQGFLLCLWDSEAVRLQTSQWKRSLLVFSSGVCLEIATLPFLGGWFGYETSWHLWLLTWLFAPLGLVGLYASKYGHDRLVEWLLVMPKLDLRLQRLSEGSPLRREKRKRIGQSDFVGGK